MQVGATAYNEGSSRSHTLIRLSVESSERPDPDADPRAAVARTLSFVNLIDLAGSESAKVCLSHPPPSPPGRRAPPSIHSTMSGRLSQPICSHESSAAGHWSPVDPLSLLP